MLSWVERLPGAGDFSVATTFSLAQNDLWVDVERRTGLGGSDPDMDITGKTGLW